jgi:SAM-dependent methyltransferase
MVEVSRSSTLDNDGTWTYTETVARGHYGRNLGGLHGKHDNVRTYWEDEITRRVLRPYVRERGVACAAANRGLRVVDLGCGAGQGYELLTQIRQSNLSLQAPERFVLEPEQIGLYLGLDISESMVEQGRQNYRDRRHIRFAAADLREGLGLAGAEAPFDLYASSYGSLSHLSGEELASCLRAVARHGGPGSVVVLDLVGRFSPEWPGYWGAECEDEKVRPYSMSYLFDEGERGAVEEFRLRFWTGDGVRELCRRVSEETRVAVEVVELVDRSVFVGRHVDTGEYGCTLPPLRRLVNQLYELNVRTNLRELLFDFRPVPDFAELSTYFEEVAHAWNTVVEFAGTRLGGSRVDLVGMEGWREFPAPLQMALVTFDRIVDSVAWIDVGDVRANLIEPQLAYVLSRMEHQLQRGIGGGHGLLAVLRLGDLPS